MKSKYGLTSSCLLLISAFGYVDFQLDKLKSKQLEAVRRKWYIAKLLHVAAQEACDDVLYTSEPSEVNVKYFVVFFVTPRSG